MTWGEEQLEKIKEFSSLLLTIVLDCGFVLFVAWITEKVKHIIEDKIIKEPIGNTSSHEIIVTYTASQVLVITVSIAYIMVDLIRHIRKALMLLKKDV